MSQVEVDKVIPQSGTTLTIGDSGDTVTIPSGATLAIAGSVTGFTSAGIDDNATSVAITIDSNENVGIGTTSPNNYSGFGNLTIGGTSGGILDFESNGTRTGSLLGLVGETRLASITNIPVTFQVNNAEKMRLNSTGLGIFNSNPSTPIHITSNTPVITFEESDQSNRQFQIGSFGNAYAINDATNSQFRYILDNSGNHVFNEGGADCDFRVESDANTHAFFLEGSSGNISIGSSTTSHAKVYIDHTGDVDDNGLYVYSNIGQTVPLVRILQDGAGSNQPAVHVRNDGSAGGIVIEKGTSGATANTGHNQVVADGSGNSGFSILSGNTSNGAVCFGDDGNNCIGYINYAHNGNHLDFGVSGAERMRVDHNSGARLFLGTTSDTSHGSADNNRLIVSGHSNNGAGLIGFVDTSGNTDGTITANDGNLIITADTQQTASNSSMQLRVDNSEKVRIVSSGYVGIGKSNPQNKIDINAETWDDGLTIKNAGNFNVGIIGDANRSGAGGGLLNLQARWNGTEVAGILFNAGSDTTNKDDGVVTFRTASAGTPTERMRIASDGVVGIGTTSPSSSYRLSAVGGTGAVVGAFIETTSTDSGHEASIIKRPNSGVLIQFLGSGQVGSITTNGSSTTYSTSSDYRLKENVSYDFDATTRLKQLKPARFNFIVDADTTVDGFIAHEVSDIVPEAISGEKDAMKTEEYEVTPAVLDEDGNVITEAVMGTREVPDYQGIDQSKLVPLLVKTIQELEARITTLENA